MIKIRLNAGIENVDGILIVDSASTIANLLMNKTRPYRFLYSKEADRYVIGEAYSCYHNQLAHTLWGRKYLPQYKDIYDVDDAIDSTEFIPYIFMPNTKEWENEIDDADDFEFVDDVHYRPVLRMTIGNLYHAMDDDWKNFDIRKDDPDLYQALKTRRLILPEDLNSAIHLSASSNDPETFFQDLAYINKEYDGAEIPLYEGTGVLKTTVTPDSLEVSVTNESGEDLAKFEAYYIEEDEYGNSLYDIYVNGKNQESLSQGDVEEAYFQWFTHIKQEVGIWEESDERQFLDNGNLSELQKLISFANRYEYEKRKDDLSEVPRDFIVKFTESTLIPQIIDTLQSTIDPILYKSLTFKQKTENGRTVSLKTKGRVLGVPFETEDAVSTRLFKSIFSYHHDPEEAIESTIKRYMSNIALSIDVTLSNHIEAIFDFWNVSNKIDTIFDSDNNGRSLAEFLADPYIKIWVRSFLDDASQEMYQAQQLEDFDDEDEIYIPPEPLTDVETFLNLPSPRGTIGEELDYISSRMKVKAVQVNCRELDSDYGKAYVGEGWIEVKLAP